MNSDEYRDQIRRQVEQALADEQHEEGALLSVAPASPRDPHDLLGIVEDSSEKPEMRRKALQALQALSFNVPLFAKIRPALIATLRKVIEDPDPELREMAIEGLAQDKDEYVQRRLLAGLKREEEPLVEDENAIQFLAYDIHAEHFPILRTLAKESSEPSTRREAVKVLAADTESADLLYEIYDDKGEDDEVRNASAGALLAVDPVRFEERAKQAVVDDSDAEAVRAASLTALTYFANPTAITSDTDFVKQVSRVETAVPELMSVGAEHAKGAEETGQLEKAVSLFQSRYGQ
jgi:hypothetical protein